MQMRLFRRLPMLLIPMLAMLVAASARAGDTGVKDDAGFFKPETVTKVNTELQQIKSEYGKDLVVETFAAIPQDKQSAYESAKDDAAQRKTFFSNWLKERAHARQVSGVYVLICREPAHLEVQAGAETRRQAFTQKNQDHLSQLLLDAFKQKQYDEGLTKAVDYFRQSLKENGATRSQSAAAAANDTFHHVGGGNATPLPQPQSSLPPAQPRSVPNTNSQSKGVSWMWIIFVIIGAIIVFRILASFGSRNSGYGGGPGYSQGPGPGYGGGYGPGYSGGGGGGGFFRNFFGGMLGGAAGSYLYDRYSHHNDPNTNYSPSNQNYNAPPQDSGTSSGGDFGSSSSGGGEDFSSGSSSGGDFGGSSDSGSSFDSGSSGGDSGGGGGGGDSGGSSGGDF